MSHESFNSLIFLVINTSRLSQVPGGENNFSCNCFLLSVGTCRTWIKAFYLACLILCYLYFVIYCQFTMESLSIQPFQSPGESSTEEHHYPKIESEEFRCGFNKPLPMEPIRLAAVWGERRVNKWRNCTKQAVNICKNKNLELSEVGTYMIRGAYSESFVPTILISVKNDTRKSLWEPILITISRVLIREDCRELQALVSCYELLGEPEMHIFLLKQETRS